MASVYVVDDSKAVRDRLVNMIAELKDTELLGNSGDPIAAIAAIHRLKPNTVILDIRMPGMNGIQVLRAIKKTPKPPAVIILTNYPFKQYRQQCIAEGADYFLNKSTEFDKILEILK